MNAYDKTVSDGGKLVCGACRVVVACHAAYATDVAQRGLEHHAVAGDPQEGRGGPMQAGPAVEERVQQQYADYQAAARGAQLLCFNWFGPYTP